MLQLVIKKMGDNIHFLRKLWVNKLGWNILYSFRRFMAVELEAAFLLIFYERLIMLREDLAKKTTKKRLFEY